MVKGIKQNIGTEVPAKVYREIDALNNSSIKVFDDEGPMEFFNQFVLKQKKDEEPSFAVCVGDLSHFLLFDCKGDEDDFDNDLSNKFAFFDGIKGSGQAFFLADELFRIVKRDNLDGFTVDGFKEALSTLQSLKEPKYKGKTPDQALKDFEEKALVYFNTKIANIDKQVVDNRMIAKAKIIVENLMNDIWTHEIVRDCPRGESLYHLPIEWEWETLFGDKIKCKSEIDKLDIDHKSKEVTNIDLKCTWSNFPSFYLKYKHYLANYFYNRAVEYWLDQEGLDNYSIVPGTRFIAADTSPHNLRPVVYKTTQQHLTEGRDGFMRNGYRYRGIVELIEDINWHTKNGVWNAEREAFIKNGILTLENLGN